MYDNIKLIYWTFESLFRYWCAAHDIDPRIMGTQAYGYGKATPTVGNFDKYIVIRMSKRNYSVTFFFF